MPPIEESDERRGPPSRERYVRSLSDRSGVPLPEVRALFLSECARLGLGAKVGSYLEVLAASSVRGMLRRKARLAAEAAQAASAARTSDDRAPPPSSEVVAERLARDPSRRHERARVNERTPQQHLRRWEDDGGSRAGSARDRVALRSQLAVLGS